MLKALWHRCLNIQFIYLFVCLFVFGGTGSSLLLAPSSSLGDRGLLLLLCPALVVVASIVAEHKLRALRRIVAARGLWGTGSVVWHTGLVAPWRVESSQIRDRTSGPCISRWILIRLYYQGCPP